MFFLWVCSVGRCKGAAVFPLITMIVDVLSLRSLFFFSAKTHEFLVSFEASLSHWDATLWWSDSGFLFMSDALSVSLSAPPPPLPVLNKTHCFQKKKSCMFVTEVLLLCVCVCARVCVRVCFLFPSLSVSLLFLSGRKHLPPSQPRLPRSKVNVSFSCVVRFVVDRCSLYWVDL